ncbi:hypothetical protein BE221DRAFT_76059, partial [Ostreococcus tauri]
RDADERDEERDPLRVDGGDDCAREDARDGGEARETTARDATDATRIWDGSESRLWLTCYETYGEASHARACTRSKAACNRRFRRTRGLRLTFQCTPSRSIRNSRRLRTLRRRGRLSASSTWMQAFWRRLGRNIYTLTSRDRASHRACCRRRCDRRRY